MVGFTKILFCKMVGMLKLQGETEALLTKYPLLGILNSGISAGVWDQTEDCLDANLYNFTPICRLGLSFCDEILGVDHPCYVFFD